MKLKHPQSKKAIEVRDDHADKYLTQGWEPVAQAAPEKAQKKDDPKG